MKNENEELEIIYDKVKLPIILILENEKTTFGKSIYRELSICYDILLYRNYYKLVNRLNDAILKNEKIFSIIIYNSLAPVAFLQFWSFVCSNKIFSKLKIFYYFNHIIYGFEGSRRVFAHPLFKIDHVDLQISIISDLIQFKGTGVA